MYKTMVVIDYRDFFIESEKRESTVMNSLSTDKTMVEVIFV